MDRGDWQEVFGYALMFIGVVLVWLRFDWLIALIVFTLILGTCIVCCAGIFVSLLTTWRIRLKAIRKTDISAEHTL